jgi:uncharacterized repeat protein (TIGR03803 family)
MTIRGPSFKAYTGLAKDVAGNLYGTTFQGGDLTKCKDPISPEGCGVVFKVTP